MISRLSIYALLGISVWATQGCSKTVREFPGATGGAGVGAGGQSGGAAGAGGLSGAGGAGAGGVGAQGGSGSSGGAGAGVGGSAGVAGSAGTGGSSYGVPGRSCVGVSTVCRGESCCSDVLLPGGNLSMGRGTETDSYAGSADETPEHAVTLSAFRLDKYEVTVSRFRKFVEAFDGTPPPVGAGAHPTVADSGWQPSWTGLPADRNQLISGLKCATSQTWTDAAGAGEDKPQNCVDWHEAFAFCAWDGGRLPTEAEWEYAAAGGDMNLRFPWGNASASCATANFANCVGSPEPVGSFAAGLGRWGNADLSGNVAEWIFDWYDAGWYSFGGNSCTDCGNASSGSVRTRRGGHYDNSEVTVRAAARTTFDPNGRAGSIGFRCVHDE